MTEKSGYQLIKLESRETFLELFSMNTPETILIMVWVSKKIISFGPLRKIQIITHD
jgi:hypothetical protein